jgi:hypothetical protein
MGHIKEPKGINFVVDPEPLSQEELKKISAIIAHYKATGKKKIDTIRTKQAGAKSRKKKLTA